MALSPTPTDVTELARQHTEAAVAALVEALNCPNERVPAATALLTIAWGAPVQPLAFDSANIIVECHNDEPPARTNGDGRFASKSVV